MRTTSLLIHTPCWTKPHTAFSLGTVPSLPFQRALWNSGTKHEVSFSHFLGAELQSPSFALGNCRPSRPQHKSISITALISEWSPIFAAIKKDTELFPLSGMKHSYCIQPAVPIFPAQFCSQSRTTKCNKQAVWATQRGRMKDKKERQRETRTSSESYFHCV